MNVTKQIGLSALIALIVGLIGYTLFYSKGKISSSGVPIVTVSTFTLSQAAHAVAGELLNVQTIVPLGSDPHIFSPNPTQVAELSKSKLFIYNGAGFETWAEAIKTTLPETTRVINMSEHVTLLKHSEHGHVEDHDAHGVYDPHYWLDIDNMITMTKTLDVEFSKLLPSSSEKFHQNATNYIDALTALKSEFSAGLAECQNRTLISNHNAFGYLAHANRLENISVIGLSSDEQPSAKTIASIIEIIKEYKIKSIFFEELVNDNVSQTIARETGVKAVALQPLENISEDELKSQQTYLSIMRENLQKLREAMECH